MQYRIHTAERPDHAFAIEASDNIEDACRYATHVLTGRPCPPRLGIFDLSEGQRDYYVAMGLFPWEQRLSRQRIAERTRTDPDLVVCVLPLAKEA